MSSKRNFDNAATSFPKHPNVSNAMKLFIDECSGSYGRSAYPRSRQATYLVEEARDLLALELGVSRPEKITFTLNATHALNIAIAGIEHKKRKVLVSKLEHNAVMRPLIELENRGELQIDFFPSHSDGSIDLNHLVQLSKSDYSLVVITHMSNVNGVIQPLKKIREKLGNDVPILLDVSQSCGHQEINKDDYSYADMIAVTGHKGLLGPTGTGALYHGKVELKPFLLGGTGSRSESYQMPYDYPNRFEAGTQNNMGIIGLSAALKKRVTPLHELGDFFELIEKLRVLDFIELKTANSFHQQGEIFSFYLRRVDNAEFATYLFETFQIETRVGLHCAPLAHKTIGTFPTGTIRISPSPFHTQDDFKFFYNALIKTGAHFASSF